MKIVFFGTSDVGLPILKALNSEHEIVHVITSPDAKIGRKQELTATPIAQYAASLDIPISKPEKVKKNVEFIAFLKSLHADIFVVVSYGKILPAELLDIPPLKTVNVHFSLLPKYRGAAPIQFALLHGEEKTGTTIFILDELVDHGPVLATQEYPIDSDDTFTSLAAKLSDVSAQLLLDILPQYEAGSIIPHVQDHQLATQTHMIAKEAGKINWSDQTAQEIYNMFRAYTPWPGIWTTYNGETFKILACKPVDIVDTAESAKSFVLCKNNTYLELHEVQQAGKNKMTIKDFLNGHSDFSSSHLGQ